MVIYDFGANKGQNLEYYLSKKLKVVAVEANPLLCDSICRKFHIEIANKSLVVLNYCLTDNKSDEYVEFFVHKLNDVLSQFIPPHKDIFNDFSIILVKSCKPSEIIFEFGSPHYIKIDLEHYDFNVLNELLSNNIKPTYLSVEVHDFRIIKKIIESKYFIFFNVVIGSNVPKMYPKFRAHSAGPFGLDLKTPWINENQIINLFDTIGAGWIDIHASNNLNLQFGDFSFSNYVFEETFLSRLLRIVKRFFIYRWCKSSN